MNKVQRVILRLNEKIWQKKLQKKNRNIDFTLITNNCIGGVIYHNLGLQFQSPTVNLYIKGKEYLEFVKNFERYSRIKMKETKEEGINFPIGLLDSESGDLYPVKVYFQHYSSFEEALEKWEKRIKRINFKNVYVIWEFYDNLYDLELLREFDSLPIKKKIILHRPIEEFKDAFVFDEFPMRVGGILEYEGFSGKRKIDRFDYVQFLND